MRGGDRDFRKLLGKNTIQTKKVDYLGYKAQLITKHTGKPMISKI